MKSAKAAGVLATMSPPCEATTDFAPSEAQARTNKHSVSKLLEVVRLFRPVGDLKDLCRWYAEERVRLREVVDLEAELERELAEQAARVAAGSTGKLRTGGTATASTGVATYEGAAARLPVSRRLVARRVSALSPPIPVGACYCS